MINELITANALDGLKTLASNSIDCVITSPPYFQLRRYGDDDNEIGTEKTINEYVSKTTEIFKEVHRVLKVDGTCFVVIADTYAGDKFGKTDNKVSAYLKDSQNALNKRISEIKRTSLIGIPERLMIAFLDSGWIIRNNIIWQKPNAMPSSVKNRFSLNYENIFFMVKSNRNYYFKQLKEPMTTTNQKPPRGSKGVINTTLNSGLRKQDNTGNPTTTGFNARYITPPDLKRNMRCVWSIPTSPSKIPHYAMFPTALVERLLECGARPGGVVLDPFAGAGTTILIARERGYQTIGIELYQKNIDLIKARLEKEGNYGRRK